MQACLKKLELMLLLIPEAASTCKLVQHMLGACVRAAGTTPGVGSRHQSSGR